MERRGMSLPTGPDALCFDKDEFMKEDFDVDHFVSDCRKRVQLEELRDDLELYYRLLKTAMVELINKDYADFVNLSTNLVGMDKALNQLSVPLGQLREEVLSLRSSVSEGIRAVDERMSKQEDIRNKKMCVLRLMQVIRSVEKIEKILNSQSSKETSELEASRHQALLIVPSPLLTGQTLERIATEFNQLQFHAVQSKGMPLLDMVRPRIAGITAVLQQSLEGLLLEGLQSCDVDVIRHCLRTYATIDKTRDAEALVGQVLVKPYVDEVIVEHFVESHPNGLQVMYDKLLEFVPHHCRLLREVTGGAVSSERATPVPGYDFLVNSVWPEIAQGLEEKLPSLFNPGNPDAFHQYTISMDFLRRFERQCGSQASVKRLRAHPAYHSFNSKWNLPVYFQIRFREVAGSLEAALIRGLEEAPAGSPFCLLASHKTWSSLSRCWSDELFLPLLAHRLWRLTLQILARFSVFASELSRRPISNESAKEIKKPLVAGSKDSSASQGGNEDQGRGPSEEKPVESISSTQLVYVVADLDRLQEQLPELLETIKPKLEMIGFENFSSISAALEDSRSSLSACVPALSSRVIQDLSESCFSYLKGALEVPRLYRRTNKEVPTTASAYMESALKPFHQLQSGHKDKLRPSLVQQWLEEALSESTHRYCETVSDVLSSVKKMEASLKRLKQARKTAAASPVGPSSGMSDDDKIRLQLALDVAYLGEQIQKMGLQTSNIKSFTALAELVAAAKDQAATEQP
ncbi:component of oligomeric golgi complex 2, transcript variant X2 [Ictidomys tridecemlineatus]|uniref:conserved oligomeric Golgi complex subunit 2 isoform X2 n=1 Tax=Ictidomys tridecemlineatus TaxID=43179 RepID=UPI000B5455D7|nr:conserved oligomeric Golgi complex subunit 2 isoform X2 [Ictidomys tridecemlineatus]KAG3257878.1 component of oligomeric golgi complex 2, transcript variant X2 [Ictidomys tridecemlineatus]